MNRALPVCVAAGLLGLAACAPDGSESGPAASRARGFPPPPEPAEASLVLLTLDTVRADAVGCGGSPTAHTPWIDRLARQGIQFRTGLASTPITAPSHASVLTGLGPPAHGVRDNGTYHLPTTVPTIAETMAEAGLATGGFVAAFPLLGRFGFSRGFEHFDDRIEDTASSSAFQQSQRPGDVVVDAAAEWISSLGARRYFAWVHLFDAHGPHDSPRAWVWAARGDDYGGDVAWADDHVGRLIRYLERSERPVWIVLTADHGESRGDHGEDTHAIFVYDATIRVPALVWPAPPSLAPGLQDRTFRGIDAPATAAELLGLGAAAAPGAGRALGPDGAEASYAESFYPRIHYGWSEIRSVRQGRWKYIRTTDPELYDLRADPAESRNLHGEHPEIEERLLARLAELGATTTLAENVELSDEEREALESLGYVTAQLDSGGDDTRRPDAKRMMRVQELLYDAMRALSARNPRDAMRYLRTAVSRDPTNPEVHRVMGMAHAAERHDEAALDALLRAKELADGDDDSIRLEIGGALMRLARPDEAAEEFRVLVERDSANADFRYNLGVARHAQGRLLDARTRWQEAVDLDPYHADAINALRRTAGAARKLEEGAAEASGADSASEEKDQQAAGHERAESKTQGDSGG